MRLRPRLACSDCPAVCVYVRMGECASKTVFGWMGSPARHNEICGWVAHLPCAPSNPPHDSVFGCGLQILGFSGDTLAVVLWVLEVALCFFIGAWRFVGQRSKLKQHAAWAAGAVAGRPSLSTPPGLTARCDGVLAPVQALCARVGTCATAAAWATASLHWVLSETCSQFVCGTGNLWLTWSHRVRCVSLLRPGFAVAAVARGGEG